MSSPSTNILTPANTPDVVRVGYRGGGAPQISQGSGPIGSPGGELAPNSNKIKLWKVRD